MMGTALVRRLMYWLVVASVVALIVAPLAAMSTTLQGVSAQDGVSLADEATPEPDEGEETQTEPSGEDATDPNGEGETDDPAPPVEDDSEEPAEPPADVPSDVPATPEPDEDGFDLATTIEDVIVTLWCFRNPELTRVDNTGDQAITILAITPVYDSVDGTPYTLSQEISPAGTRIFRSNTGATTGTILTTDSLYTTTVASVGVKIETTVGTVEADCGPNPNAQVTLPSDILITLSCLANPELTRIDNTGAAGIVIYSIETLADATASEPYVVDRPLGAGRTVIYRSGPGAVTGTILTPDYIYTDEAYDLDGVRLNTSIGVIEKQCAPKPPTYPTELSITISCATAPETVTVKNIGQGPATIVSLTSLYQPTAEEPFSLNKTLQPGQGIIYRSGDGTGANFLTKNYIYDQEAGASEGVRIVVSTGKQFVTRCPAWGPKWIEVNLTTQVLTAWQGNQVVATSYVATGKNGFWTPTGTFYINSKPGTIRMAGCSGGECWDVPNVPASMAFTYNGHYIHGAYWHNNFGTARTSHGCVNLPVDFSWWLFNWTPMWTEVRIHY